MKITSASSATGTIIADNDLAQISLGPPSVSERERENGSFNYTVTLSQALDEDVILTWTATAGDLSASVDDDLADGTGTVIIEAGRTQASFTIGIVDDELAEGDESFIVAISASGNLPDGVTIDPMAASSTATITDNETAEISIGDAVATEGSSIAFTVDSTNLASDGAVLDVTVESGTASLDDDLELRNNSRRFTVSIFRGDKSVTFRVPVVDDAIVEGSESFTVTIAENPGIPLPGGAIITRATATGTITDNDDATVSISPTAPAQDEGGTFTFAVTLSAPVAEDVTVTWTAEGSGGNAAMVTGALSDLAATQQPNGMVVFPANSAAGATREFTIATLDDIRVEGAETFEVTLSGDLPDDVEFGDGTATATINADANDTAPVSISPTAPAQDEGGTFTFTVTLSEPVAEDVTVTWTAAGSGGNAATVEGALSDLAATQQPNGMVVFPANSAAGATREFTIATLNDTRVEGAETFEVTLSGALPGGVEFGDGTATATINADATDTATVSLSPLSPSVAEGGTFTFTATLSASVSEAVTVRWTAASGTATVDGAGSDLASGQATTATVTFPADSAANATQTFTIATNNDDRVEGSETFTVSIAADDDTALPDGVEIGSADEATATITEDDAAELSIVDGSGAEGASVVFDVSLSAASALPVTVRWTATSAGGDGAATLQGAGSDLASGEVLTGTVVFEADDTAVKTVSLATVNDAVVEGDETFTVTLSPDTDTPLPAGVTIPSAGAAATGTIADNDAGLVTLDPPNLTAAENGTFAYTVKLSKPADEAVNITWTASRETTDTASVLDDLQQTTGTVTFDADRNTDQPFSIAVADDDLDEDNETFTVTLTATSTLPTGVSIPTATNTHRSVATITDNDDAPEVNVSIANESVAENVSGGTATFTATLSEAVDGNVVLAVAVTAGTGTNPVTLADDLGDLGDLPTTVTIDQGQIEATFTVPITDDGIVEGDETFLVTLSEGDTALPEGVTIGTGAATGTIEDNDEGTVSLSPAMATAAEDDGVFTYTVSLSAAADEDVTVRWTASIGPGDTATLGDLQTPRTGTVTFDANTSTDQTFTISPVDDGTEEEPETFTVMLSADIDNPLPTGVSIPAATASSTATITDSSNIFADARWTIADAEPVDEGGTARFEITIEPRVPSPGFELPVKYTGGTAELKDLEKNRPDTLSFNQGDTSVTLEVPIENDVFAEGEETFTVTIVLAERFGHSPITIQATGTINASDPLTPVTVDIADATPVAENGGNATFTVTLSEAVTSNVVLDVEVTAGTGTSPVSLADDLGDLPPSVMIAQSQIEASFTVPITNDNIVEGDETFNVTVSLPAENPPGFALSLGEATAVGTITDDDRGTVSLSPDETTAAEGGSFAYIVSLSAAADEAVDITWTASREDDQTATVVADLQSTTGTVSFDAGSKVDQPFTIAVSDDDLLEPDETFTVTLTATNTLPTGVTIPTASASSVATIPANDDPTDVSVTIGDESVAESGGSVTFTVDLDTAADSDVVLDVAVTAGTATLADDLGTPLPPDTVTIDMGDTEATITVPIKNDDIVEGDETFTVTISAPTATPLPDGVTIDDGEATGTITDTDTAELSIATTATAAEGAAVEFTVSLSAASAAPVTVRWTATTAGGDGAATLEGTTSDLTASHVLTGTVEFTANDMADKTVRLATVDDAVVEGDETFTVTLSPDTAGGNPLPTRVTISPTARAGTGTITEDDAAELSIVDGSGAEGASVVFDVSLSAASALPVTVRWTATSAGGDGAATLQGAGSDLASGEVLTGTVVFEADDTAVKTVSLATVNDAVVEGDETFTVTLSPDTDTPLPAGVTIPSAGAAATGTITEDDAATVSLSPLSPSAAEGGTFTFTATLSASVSEAVTVRWTAASGTATVDGAGSDLASGQDITATVEFAANSAANATQTFTIATNNDDLVEGSETFTVTLSPDDDTALPDGVTVGDDDEATATITETDAATVSLSPLSPSAAEGGTFTFTATLSASVSESVTVRWTAASGTATVTGAGSDLGSGQATTATVEFPANSAANATQTFMIATNNDDLVEGSETFTVSIAADDDTALPDGVEIGSDDEATATITETDAATVSLSPLSPSVAEGGTFTFTATLSASVSEAVTVRWTAASGTATVDGAGSDLASGQATTATVEFPADSAANATQTFTIATNNDDRVEGSETFTVSIAADDDTALPDGVEIGSADEATATITEDDAAELSIVDGSGAEGASVVFDVSLSAASALPVTVRWTATSAGGDGAATLQGAGSDLASGEVLTGTVVFEADDTAVKTVSLATVNDAVVEGDETFTVTLSPDTDTPLPAGVTIPSAGAAATGTITEDDAATVSLSPLSPSAAEGGTFTFTATLSASVSEAVTVRWTAASGTATVDGAGSDLGSGQATTATVTFPADSAANATQTFTIATNNDARVEGSETFTVSIAADDDTALPDGVEIGSADEATATITETDAATVSLSPLSPSVAEGGTFTFTVTLSASVSEAVTVRWTAALGTATVTGAGSDLASGQDITATVEFAADSAANATQTFTIATNNDARVEGSETFTVSIAADDATALPDGVEIGSADEATATITETDAATVSLSPLSPSVAEGGMFTFTATLNASVSEAVTVRWTAASGTATVDGAGSDLASGQDITATVEFAANSAANATQTFTIATNNDARVEGSETFTVTLSPDDDTALPDGVEIGADDEATGTITEDDAAELSIADGSGAEGGSVVFDVSLSAASSLPVTVRWTATTAGGDGAATLEGDGSDLAEGEDLTGTVEFAANDNAVKTVSLATVDDALVEGSETFTVTLSPDTDNPLPAGVTIPSAGAAATGTITETDAATVSLSPLSPSAAEGGTFTFTATLSAAVSEPVTVRWTAASGTATVDGAGSDLASGQDITATVTFPADSAANATQTFTIATNNDDLVEGSETFTVSIAADDDTALPDGVTVGSADEATATITETDAATVTLSPLSPSVAEGGTFTFTATLSAAVSEPVTVRWTAASGTATVDGAGSDLASGQATTATVEFPADSAANATQTFTIATNNDDLVEGSETFTVSIAADSSTPLPDGVTVGSADEATATITETDAATVSLSPLSPSVAEGGTFTFTATLSASVSEAVTVRWTATDGTATVDGAGSDLASGQATTATVTFPADSAANATQTFTIATNNDARVEGSETFTVTLSPDDDTALPDGVEIGADDEATGTITEDDAAELSIADGSGAEGGSVVFDVSLSAASSLPVTVRWTATTAGGDGAATLEGDGSDLASGEELTGTVEFAANDNAVKTVSLATVDDALVEGSETFTVTLSPDTENPLPAGVTIPSGGSAATGTITEDETATVSLSPLSPSVAEGGTFTFTATLSAPVSEPVTVRWTAASGTATVDGAGSDLGTGQATTATVTFPADSAANATQTFTIATNNDALVEGSETFTVTLSPDDDTALPDGVTVGSADEATATITETDAATVSLSPLSPSAAEGGTFTFTATLSASVSEAVTVRWTAASGTATVDGAGSDLASGQDITATVTFPADSAANATQTFTIATNNDDLVEGSETFTVSIAADSSTPLPDGVEIGADDEATATITETDAATVSLSPLSPSVAEGGTFTFTATLSASVSEPVTVRWTAASGTATVTGAGSDLASGQATTGTVEFAADSAANATQTFTIATANDDRVEGSETFTVSIAADSSTPLPDGVEIGSADEATATITETDAATVSLSPLSPSAAEGGTFTFTATLSAPVSEPVTVRWTAASGTATVTGAGSDLASGQATTATVEFPADSAANATRTFTIATNNDDLVEGSETFTVSIAADDDTALPDGVEIGSDDEAAATITETDAATVSLSPLSPSAAEGGTFTFTATLSAAVSEAVTVRWTAASGTATVDGAGSDLTSGQDITATVVFPANGAANATQTFTIATDNDDLVEGSETFTVTLSPDPSTPLPDGVEIGSDDEAAATITETDAATVSLSPLSPSAAEGGTFTFTATLSAAVSEPVTVRWTAASGTATVTGAGSDLASGQATTATVTFPADSAANATQTFTIATNDDDRVEGSETFTVSIAADDDTALPDGVTVGSADEATATITETDAATVTLSPLSPSVAEGGTFTFTATLSAAVSEAVTVRWTAASGTATVDGAGSDLASGQATTATVEFPANSAANATQTFTIATNNDDLVEGSETFTVSIAADDDTALPDGVTVGSADEATATITETDAATVTLSPLSPSVAEGGTFTFTATLSAAVSEAVTVRWTAASGTATVDGAGSDLASGQATTATVEFPADSAANATQTFTIATDNDDLVEGSETFTVSIAADPSTPLPDGVEIGSDDEAAATITETDAATVSLSPLSPSAAEGGTFTFTATLSAAVSEPVTVRWTAASGTATVTGAGSDLASGQATTATVTFPADSAANATQTFTIATANDTLVEGSETFTVTLGEDTEGGNDLPDGVEVGADDEATATITETDAATVSLSPLSPSVAEGGTFTFTATLSAAVSEAVRVRWTAATITATVDGAGSDLASGQATTATVTFPADSAANATQTFTIATANDTLVEGSETFTVTLGEDTEGGNDLPDGVEVGADDEATATITEDDAATVALSPLSPSVAEGGTFTFTATLSASVSEPVTVRWTAASGTATVDGAGSDLASGQATTATVEFPADSAANATQTFTIATNNDDLVEGSETFTVSIAADDDTALPDGVTVGSADEATATITETDAATVTLSPLSPSVAEGGTFTFTATLSAAVSEAVTVRWTAASGTATVDGAGSDLASGQATTATVEFPADSAANATQEFTIATANDARVEGSETFTVTLGEDTEGGNDLPDGVEIGSADEATATITETDAATVSLSPLSPSVAEGGTFTFTATLSAAVSEAVTVRWTAASGTATVDGAGSDLASGQATTATVEFPADSAANATQTFTIATDNDDLVEGSETFTVSIAADSSTPLPDGVEIGSDDEAAATITETDAATVSLSPLSPSAAEGGTFTFTATLSAPVSEPVRVRWTAASGTATVTGAGSDLASGQATTATVEFPADSAANATQTFTIATNNDDLVEGSETFTVSIAADDDTALPDGVTVGSDDEAAATITETDAATVSLSPLSPSVAEGGTFTFTATLSAAVSEAVTVRWTAASGTATVDGAGSDLASGQATTATVEFPADSAANATQEFTIATANDARVEGSETFTVTLGEDTEGGNDLPDGVEIGSADEATATITETDAATVSLSPLSPSVAEGGTFTFTATLSAAVSEAVTVRWTATDGTATVDGAGSDLASGQATTATVTFPADSAANATQTFTIATNNDDLVEGSETFTVSIAADDDTALPDGVEIGADDEATATITETDAATVSLSPLSPSVAEGGTFTFTATLSAAVSEAVTVRWTATDGTATVDGAGSDLASGQATTATVTFPADSAANATQTFTIATNNDARVEGSETFTVTLSPDDDTALPDGVEIGADDEATGTITEDDAAELSIADGSGAEGGSVVFDVSLSAASSLPVTVRWTATTAGGDGAATLEGDGSDLASGEELTGTVEFAANDNAVKTVSLATVDDALVEGSETFTVTLSPDTIGGNALPAGVTIPSAGAAATGTITEDDAATVSLSPLSPSVAEGGTFTFTATLSAPVSEPVTVRWTAASGTATVDGAGSDLGTGQATTATVTFPADSAANATQTFTIATNNDDLVEGSETFTVTLSPDDDTALPDGVTVGSADEATATITETDAATVSLSPLSPSAAEGGTFTFTATLSASVSEAVTVRWTAASGTATVDGAGSDLASGQDITATVTFPADSAANATQTFTIATNNDDLVEGSETFTVSIAADSSTPLPDGVEIGADDEATATITETDAATVSLSPLSPSVAEGGTFTFTATLSASVSEPVTVRWTAASGTATVDGAGSDLASGQATTGTVEFAADSAANATQTFTIATANDDRVEGSETFTVSIAADSSTPLPDGVEIGSADEATATITETDAATVSLSPLSPSAAEGGTFTFTATLSAPVSEPVTVRWTAASGTATVTGAGSDLASGQATTATVEFPANSAANATQTFTIATNNDDLVEGSETFTVSIAADDDTALPDGVEIGSDDEAAATITETDAATVSLSPLSPSAAEGGTFTFTATLSAAVSEAVTVRWTAASGTATVDGAGSDLTSGQDITATVVFPANGAANATQTFEIATNNDDLVEGSETFTVTLSPDDDTALPDGVEIGSADEATATITETDAATVSLSPLSPSVAEGGTFTFTATLSASASESVTVRWTAASGTATVSGAGSDLAAGQATTATVVFPADSAANATQTFTIATNNDARVEGSETFTVTLSPDDDTALPDGVTVGSADEATATITETDAATVSLSPLSPSVAEGGTFTFTATLSASVSEAVTVRWTAASGTATVSGAGSDLGTGQATTGTVEFAANSAANATQTFTIATANDTRVEGSETFTVSIAADSSTPLPDGVEIGSDDEATATITETDAATVSLSPLSPSAAEGGTFTFTATLSASVSEPVTVRWTATSGTAPGDATLEGAGSDLASGQATTATVTFPADSAANATQTFTIATRDDAVAEGDETFTVTIGADPATPLPDGVEIGDDDEAEATITDGVDAATVSLSPLSPSAAEGGTFTFTATLSAPVSEPVTVRWTAASGTARVDGRNSDLASGQATTGTVEFAANSAANTTRTFTIATRNDAVAEGPETFTVSIAADPDTALPPGVSIGGDDEARATITDAADATTVTLSPSSSSRAEGGTFSFTVTLNGSSSSPVTVRWRARASGDNPATLEGRNSDLADGQAIGGTVVTFPANSPPGSRREIDIATRDDAVAEGDETFTVDILNDPARPLPTGVTIGDANEATATIRDAADATTVTLSPSSSSRAEGGTFSFTVTLNGSSSSPVTVRWRARASGDNPATLEGSASDLADGQAIGGTVVTFPANSPPGSTREIDIATRDDAVAEGDETFTVDIIEDPAAPLPPGVTVGDDDEAAATITDEADAATVSLSPLSPSVAEGGTFTFTVALNRASSSPVTVRWTAASGTARVSGANSDLADGQTTTGTVTFQANSTASQTFTIATRDDAVAEGPETFTVGIAADPGNALPPGVSIGDDDEATATITDAADATTVSLSPSSSSRAEGGTFSFTVTLNGSSSSPVTVRWRARASGDNPATLEGSASDLADGQAIGGTVVTFPANSPPGSTREIDIATRDDAVAEGDETFTVDILEDPAAPLPPGVTVGDDDEAAATITDASDTATVSLSPLSPSVAEGGTFTFTVALNRASSLPVTVRWTAASGTARVSGEDSDLADGQAATGSVIFRANSAANATQTFTIATRNDAVAEGDETFTVSIAAHPVAPLPPWITIGDDDEATATIEDDDGPEPSVLIEPRLIGAASALRRHVNRFDNVTGTVARNRLTGSGKHNLTLDVKAAGDRRDMTVSSQPFEHRWSAWIDGAYAGIGGNASGYQADIYGGVDYRGDGGDWLIGALIGYEAAGLKIGEATYRSDFIHLGLYGGARLSEHLLFDGAATYGLATPKVALGDVSASYDANRITARGALTGDFGPEYGLWTGSVRVEPQVGLLYARETLGAFTDSAGGVAGRDILDIGRFSAGPRLTWDFDGVRVEGGARMQWDFLQLEDGVDGRVSGAADIGVKLDLAPGFTFGVQGDVDGIGIMDEFRSLGGKIELNVRF